MTLFLVVLVAALVFEYINGFHDAANAIATVVSTKVLTPRQAIMMAAFFNLFGALMGTAVATTIGRGLVDAHAITMVTVFGGLFAAIVWGLFTWWLGLPSSSSHALVGGLCGAALSTAKGDWSVLKWSSTTRASRAGRALAQDRNADVCLAGHRVRCRRAVHAVSLRDPQKNLTRFVNRVFGKLQLVSAAWMGFSHGSNDAQKTMGIIALALFTGTQAGAFNNLPTGSPFCTRPSSRCTNGS